MTNELASRNTTKMPREHSDCASIHHTRNEDSALALCAQITETNNSDSRQRFL